jgi:hypothetical protein
MDGLILRRRTLLSISSSVFFYQKEADSHAPTYSLARRVTSVIGGRQKIPYVQVQSLNKGQYLLADAPNAAADPSRNQPRSAILRMTELDTW